MKMVKIASVFGCILFLISCGKQESYVGRQVGLELPRASEEAYWFFEDRHEGEGTLTQRGSWNYTAALYDAGTDTLYYLEFDT